MNATGAVLRTTLRGATLGMAGLALLGGVLAFAAWAVVLRALVVGQAPGLPLALAMPVFAGFIALMFSALFTSIWVLMQRQAALRLAPHAGQHLRHAMAWAGGLLWLLLGLPVLAVCAAESMWGRSGLPLGVALIYALGLPLAGGAASAAFLVLPARPWVRWAAAVAGFLPIVIINFLKDAATWPPLQLQAAMSVAGITCTLLAAWALVRVTRALTGTHALRGAAPPPPWSGLTSARDFEGRTPRDSRWLACPYLVSLRARNLLWLVALVLFITVLPPYLGSPGLEQSGVLMVIFAGTSCPWLVGAWVSPRWSLLPGGLARRGAAWQVLGQSLRGAAPRVGAMMACFAATAAPMPNNHWPQWLANLILSAGVVVLSGCLAVASLPWFRSSLGRVGGPMLALIGGVVLQVVAQGMNAARPAAEQFWPPAMALLLSAACIGAGLLAMAASTRAWARYDWARMPAQPPTNGMLTQRLARQE